MWRSVATAVLVLVLVEPDKSADLCWFDLDALPEPLVPHERYVYEALHCGGLPGITAYGFLSRSRRPDRNHGRGSGG